MKAGGGGAKGSEFERIVAKQLSRWATNGDRADVFWRTPGSGSRATRLTALAHAGDICATHEIGRKFCEHVVLECKSYKRLDCRHLFIEQRGDFYAFWLKLLKECTNARRPLLIIKENARPPLAITDETGHARLFCGYKPLVTTHTGMYVQQLALLYIQPYDLVCHRLTGEMESTK